MRYNEEHREFIRKVSPGRYNADIADLFNAEFGTSITEGQIKSFKSNHNIKSNVPKRRITTPEGLFTKEQEDFIKENVEGTPNKKLAAMVNESFNLSVTPRQVKTWKKNHGLSSGLKGTEGIAPKNKGTKGIYNVGGNRTSFKKGQRPSNYKPVGTERVDRDGYVLVKVSDEGPWHKRWKHKQRIAWEKEHGPLPSNRVLLFGDGDKTNCDLDNLILADRKQLAVLNRKGLHQNDKELNKTALIIADLHMKMTEAKKKGEAKHG